MSIPRFLLPFYFFFLVIPWSASALVSDDFFLPGLDFSRWEKIDPLGDAAIQTTGSGSADARLLISVPAGRSHDLWADGLNAPRLRQPCGDGDFSVEVKFDSPLSARFQSQGILAEGPGGALRFEFLGDGSGIRLFAAEIRPGAAAPLVDRTITGGVPRFMRVTRAGSQWTQTYSFDGGGWLPGGSFTSSLAMTTIGVYAGNAGSSPPAHTAAVDYVFNSAAPLEPEDGGPAPDLSPPVFSQVQATPRSASALIAWTTDEPSSGEVEYGTDTGGSLGTVTAAGAATSHWVELLSLQPETVYWFRIRARDPAGNQSASELHSFRTAAATTCRINLWYGTSQIFGQPGVSQHWANLLGDVAQCADFQALSYVLNGGPERPLAVGPDGRRLSAAGDFNIDIARTALEPGLNRVDVIARDAFGIRTVETVHIDWRNRVWPLPFRIDWLEVDRLQEAVQVVDGKWQVSSGAVRPSVLGYDRNLAIGDLSWTDYEALLDFTVLAVDPAGYTNPASWAPGLGVHMRWQGHTDAIPGQPLAGWLPVGGTAWYEWGDRFRFSVNGRSSAVEASGKKVQLGVGYKARMRVETEAGGVPRYRFRFWPASQAEPGTWDLEGTGATTDPKSGSLLLTAHHLDVRFGELVLTPASGADATPPVISSVGAAQGATGATISWLTDEPSRGQVDYGPTAELGGTVSESSYSTGHLLTLASLLPGTTYYFRVSARDAAGNEAVSAIQSFQTGTAGSSYLLTTAVSGSGAVNRSPDRASYTAGETVILTAVPAPGWTFSGWSGALGGAANPASLVMEGNRSLLATFVATGTSAPSDEFNGSALDTALWSFVNPRGDAAVSVSGGRASISVPGGTSHDAWTDGNFTPRLRQGAPAGDFEAEVKFDSALPARFQMQGIMVEAEGAFLRSEFLGDGAGTRLFVAVVRPGGASVKADLWISSGTPRYLRVKRAGNAWTVAWSSDGVNWSGGAAFEEALAVTAIGVHAGNAGDSPPHTALVDYFRLTGAPPAPGSYTLSTGVSGSGAVSRSPDRASYAAGETVTLTAVPAAGWAFSGWSGALGGAANPASLVMDGNRSVLATFLPTGTSAASDEFNGSALDTALWSFVNPRGDAGVSVSGGQAAIAVPGGTAHDAWTEGNFTPRLRQGAPAGDFAVEVKFDSALPARFQMQGVMVEAEGAFLRSEFLGDGAGTRLFVAVVRRGGASVKADLRISSGTPRYLRVKRAGNAWTVAWSSDGVNWSGGAAFEEALAVTAIGVHAGNAGDSPPHTALVDWFRIVK